jgi:signal transduction histidine kinase
MATPTPRQKTDFFWLDAVPVGLMVADRSGVLHAVNQPAAALLDLEASASEGRRLFDCLPSWRAAEHPLLRPADTDGHARLASAGKPIELTSLKGRPVRISAIPLAQAGDDPRLVLLVVLDGAEIVELRQRLQRAEHQASIGKLARGVAHELNNPLDGVLRYTHLALTHLPEDSTVREYLVHVKEGLDRMVKAAKAFLEFSRQVTSPSSRTADVNELIDGALLLVNHRAKFQQVMVVRRLDPTLPAIPEMGLQHAAANLIKNAFDAMPRGGTLTITTRRVQDDIEIEVSDTGCGIPTELMDKVFEPFFTTKAIHQGSGLGLTMVKEVIERMGGRVTCESQAGAGSTFRLYVPIQMAG